MTSRLIYKLESNHELEAYHSNMDRSNLPYSPIYRRLLWLPFFIGTLTTSVLSHAEDLSLIVNSNVEVDSISRNKARGIFSMRLREWSDGTPIVVYVLPDQASQHRNFVQNILSMFPHQLRRHWDRYVYTGIGQAPIEVSSLKEMLQRVNDTTGAIGYINEEAVNAETRKVQLH